MVPGTVQLCAPGTVVVFNSTYCSTTVLKTVEVEVHIHTVPVEVHVASTRVQVLVTSKVQMYKYKCRSTY